jgi:hypothetical protein
MKNRGILTEATALDLIYSLIALGEFDLMHIIRYLEIIENKNKELIKLYLEQNSDPLLLGNKQKQNELVAAAIERLSVFTKIQDWTKYNR